MRKAGDAIDKAIEQIFRPNVDRSRTDNTPYWYGLDEQGWMNMANYVDNTAKQKIREGDLMGARMFVKKQLGVDDQELNNVMKDMIKGKPLRHIKFGVPHAHSGEKVMRDALILSGHHSRFAHGGDGQATDLLTTMLSNLDTYMDVQHRTGRANNLSIGALMNMNRDVGINAYLDAMPSDTIGTIIDRAKESGKWTEDKLLHTLNPEFNSNARIDPSKQKDMLIGGRFANVQNLTKPHHGFYDPAMPRDIEITDLNRLRSAVLGASKKEFEKEMRGKLILPRYRGDDTERKMKFNIPMSVVNEIAKRDDILNPDVIRQMEKGARN